MQFSIHAPRSTLPEKLISLVQDCGAKHLFANIEYEVDELRRDIRVVDLAIKSHITCEMIHDKLLVNPGIVKTKQGKDYTVRVFTLLNVHHLPMRYLGLLTLAESLA